MKAGLYHRIQLPGLVLPGNLFLAPLAGYTDRAFRGMCIRYGADLTYTEMVSCEGIIRKNKKTSALMTRGPNENLLAFQIFTGQPESAGAAVDEILPLSPSLIDLNCGCPVPKVNKAGAGAALMQEPLRLGEIVKAIKTALYRAGAEIPVTVKIRSGWDATSLNYREAALRAVEAGADMVTLHPRTRKQGYSGKADWEMIQRLKEVLPVPVIGSGDLFTPQDAGTMLDSTGCDGVMFARGSLGNPFIFRNAKQYLLDEKETSVSAVDRLDTAREHLALALETMGERQAWKEMKKHLCNYTKGIPGGAELRNQLVKARSMEEYVLLINQFQTL